ncbi:MAG TPA: UdgX family uracil-DNA binding protein [Phycicoccus sp.]|nr:UdgX family uracil-DNA binding protein [Phycicoccus sp.]
MTAAPSPAERAAWPDASHWLPPDHEVPVLATALQACRGCDLHAGATQAVPGAGPFDADLMLVGEQPGDREDVSGEPFVGPAGRLLDEALTEAGIDPRAAFRTNAVKHFRHVDRGHKRIHRTPTRWQVAQCRPWLLAELDAVRPRTVILLGATAGRSVYGPAFTVEAYRGRELVWPEGLPGHAPARVLATVHPAAVLRSRQRDEALAGLVADLRLAVRPPGRAAPARP